MRSSMRVVEIGSRADARLVHEDDVRLDRERSRDTQPLLLTAGQAERAVLEPVLHLVPERRLAQRPARRSSSNVPFMPRTRGPKAMLS